MKTKNLPLLKVCSVVSVYGHKFAQNLVFSYTLFLLHIKLTISNEQKH